MAKTPADRYGSGREMAGAFKAASEADGIWQAPEKLESLFDPLTRPILEISRAGEPTRRFDIREGPVVLGRHEACQQVVASPRMSRLHAVFYTHRGRTWIADLQSQNGTKYQGRQLTPGVPVPLRADGDPSNVTLYDQELDVRVVPS